MKQKNKRSKKSLTIKERMIIRSRRDRMDPMKPTALQVIALLVCLVALMWILNESLSNMHKIQSVSAEEKSENEVQLTFVGDMGFARYTQQYGDRNGYSVFFEQIKKLWQNSDFIIGNLECVVLEGSVDDYEENPNKQILFPATRGALEAVYESGMNAVSIANNHAIDYGAKGIQSEISIMEEVGIDYIGGGKNIEEAAACKYFMIDGLKIAVLGVSMIYPEGTFADDYTVSSSRYTWFYKNVHDASLEADLVIVYAHWGEEYALKTSKIQNSISHRLIESGADIIIGSHPHVLQNIEQYQDGIIFYSIGNFIFDQGTRETRNSVMVQLNIDKTNGNGEFVLIPIRIDELTPHATQNMFYISSIHNTLLKTLPDTSYTISDDERIRIPFSVDLMKGNTN